MISNLVKGRPAFYAPSLDEYPRALPARALGEERRVTIDGTPLASLTAADGPLVTVITIVYQNIANLGRAIESVFAQDYRTIEYIIIDGGSTDGTVDLIKSHTDRLSYWHSRSDGGIADAFNTGVALARGEFVGLVNSDDWLSPEQIHAGCSVLRKYDAPFVYGDLVYHNPATTKPCYLIEGAKDYRRSIRHGMPQFTHPTALVRRSVYQRYGLFDPSLRIGMDYDWLLRLFQAGVIGRHSSDIVGHMSLGGISDRRWRECLEEHRDIAIYHGGNFLLLELFHVLKLFRIRFRMFLERYMPERAIMGLRSILNSSLRLTEAPDVRHR